MKANYYSNRNNIETYTARIAAVALLAILLLLALTGCRNGATTTMTANAPNPVGIYSLVSVDGKSLPCVLNHAGTTMTIQSGTFTITAEGRCVSSIKLSVTNNQAMTKVTRARYTQSGDELTMKWDRAGTTRGKVNDHSFTMTNENMIFAYQK